jgi:ribose 5-phosphate isomerase B
MSIRQEEIEAIVREVVRRTLGNAASGSPAYDGPVPSRPVIDETAVRQMPAGTSQIIPANSLVTPLARQVALERKISLLSETPADKAAAEANTQFGQPTTKIVAIGADHGGYSLKETLKPLIIEAGYQIIDCGTNSSDSVDYPDYAYAVARLVADDRAWRGIMIDGAGIGSCMTANKVPGVRAAMCYDQATAVNSREHNNANVLTLGAGLIGPALAGQIVKTWLATDFGGGRHGRRVDKIDAIGKRYQ